MAAFTDARIAALKAGLELTPDQAKNWPAFEQAVREMAQLRIQRIQARQAREQQNQINQAATSPFDRLSQRADNMSKTSAALKKVADAGAPLYQSLDDAQKGRFTMLARMLRPHHHMVAPACEGGWRQGREAATAVRLGTRRSPVWPRQRWRPGLAALICRLPALAEFAPRSGREDGSRRTLSLRLSFAVN